MLVSATTEDPTWPSGDGATKTLERLTERLPLDSSDDLSNWKTLVEDTKLNETVRRAQVHQMLAASGLVSPDALRDRLYKEVLHSDLSDPYLGLGDVLFATYPFKEDK